LCHLSNQKQKQISKRDVQDSIQILNHIYLLFLINVHALLSSFFCIPACNLQVIGQVKATSASRAGMSTSIASATAASNAGGNMRVSKPHEGMLADSYLYNRVPGHLQRKALKVIAAKLALAIRCF
jgi:RNA processing factor Prp31